MLTLIVEIRRFFQWKSENKKYLRDLSKSKKVGIIATDRQSGGGNLDEPFC
jgi:hypothetical protein